MKKLRTGLSGFCLTLVLGSCGQPPKATPAAPAGKIVAFLLPTESLQASRLAAAGCVAVVATGENSFVAEFSTEDCPAEGESLEAQSVVFRLDLVPDLEDKARYTLQKAGTRVGAVTGQWVESTRPFTLRIEHLCQISDPHSPPERHLSELCRIEFNTEAVANQGRYHKIQLASLEQLARAKVLERDSWEANVLNKSERISSSEKSHQILRRELTVRMEELRKVQEELEEAQRGLRDAQASNQSVVQRFERLLAENELKLAGKDVKYLELNIRFTKSEAQRAVLLAQSLEQSERARKKTVLVQDIVALFATASKESTDYKKLISILEQTKSSILPEGDVQKISDEKALAQAEGAKLSRLENEHAEALKIFNQQKAKLGPPIESSEKQQPSTEE